MTDINTTVPDWAQSLTPELSAPPKKRAVVSETPAAPRTNASRISAAREISIAWSKSSNPFNNGDSYWRDFAGPETSAYDAMHLVFIARLLEVPLLNRSKFIWDTPSCYNARTGMFNLSDAAHPVSIAELKTAVTERVKELGLSEAKIWEWMSVSHPDDDFGRKIWRESLEQRVSRWRVAAEEAAS